MGYGMVYEVYPMVPYTKCMVVVVWYDHQPVASSSSSGVDPYHTIPPQHNHLIANPNKSICHGHRGCKEGSFVLLLCTLGPNQQLALQ
jgi:hypothetical protein